MAETAEMDVAAEIAANELNEKIKEMSAADLVAWWAKNYMKAGHKRLGRVLVDAHKRINKV